MPDEEGPPPDVVCEPAIDTSDSPETPSATDDDDRGRWVAAAAYTHPLAAHIARIKLESDGIDCYLDNELFVTTAWLYSIATGGVKLMVRAADAADATRSLREKVPHAPDAREAPPDAANEPVCPHCGSADVAPDRPWNRLLVSFMVMIAAENVGVVLLGLGVPLMIGIALRSAVSLPWKCGSCAHHWWGRASAKGFEVLSGRAGPAALPLPVPVLPLTPPPATAP